MFGDHQIPYIIPYTVKMAKAQITMAYSDAVLCRCMHKKRSGTCLQGRVGQLKSNSLTTSRLAAAVWLEHPGLQHGPLHGNPHCCQYCLCLQLISTQSMGTSDAGIQLAPLMRPFRMSCNICCYSKQHAALKWGKWPLWCCNIYNSKSLPRHIYV